MPFESVHPKNSNSWAGAPDGTSHHLLEVESYLGSSFHGFCSWLGMGSIESLKQGKPYNCYTSKIFKTYSKVQVLLYNCFAIYHLLPELGEKHIDQKTSIESFPHTNKIPLQKTSRGKAISVSGFVGLKNPPWVMGNQSICMNTEESQHDSWWVRAVMEQWLWI